MNTHNELTRAAGDRLLLWFVTSTIRTPATHHQGTLNTCYNTMLAWFDCSQPFMAWLDTTVEKPL